MILTTSIMCDDVRTESNGKSIYVGVYNGISVDLDETNKNNPKLYKICFIFRFADVNMKAGEYTLTAKFQMNNELIYEIPLQAKWTGDTDKIDIILSIGKFPIYQYGKIETELNFILDGEIVNVYKIPFTGDIVKSNPNITKKKNSIV